ncbi:MAG: hypothetical protein MHMPM18_003714 [Marteilia pararefringens]
MKNNANEATKADNLDSQPEKNVLSSGNLDKFVEEESAVGNIPKNSKDLFNQLNYTSSQILFSMQAFSEMRSTSSSSLAAATETIVPKKAQIQPLNIRKVENFLSGPAQISTPGAKKATKNSTVASKLKQNLTEASIPMSNSFEFLSEPLSLGQRSKLTTTGESFVENIKPQIPDNIKTLFVSLSSILQEFYIKSKDKDAEDLQQIVAVLKKFLENVESLKYESSNNEATLFQLPKCNLKALRRM